MSEQPSDKMLREAMPTAVIPSMSVKTIRADVLDKIADIRLALGSGAYLSALALALAIPDICGSLMCPKSPVGQRYRCWFEEYAKGHIDPYSENSPKPSAYPEVDGDLCYRLRCAYLHNGNADPEDNWPVNEFEFVLVESASSQTNASAFGTRCIDGGETITRIRLDLPQFCLGMCHAAEDFYAKFKKRLDFADTGIMITVFNQSEPDGLETAGGGD